MTSETWWALSPLLAVTGAAVGIVSLLCVRRHHAATAALCALGLAAALWLTGQSFSHPATPVRFNEHAPTLLSLDAPAAYMHTVLFAAAFAITLFANDYFHRETPFEHESPLSASPRPRVPASSSSEEFYLLLLLATLGGAVLAAATHFVTLFLGLEILSVSLYAMIAYRPDRPVSVEGAMKYLVLTGVASAVLLFGMALLYAQCGTMDLSRLTAAMPSAGIDATYMTQAGLAMMLVGIGFKLAWAPLHLWAGEVFRAAPTPATAAIATVSKGAVFAMFLRVFTNLHHAQHEGVTVGLTLLAGLSMCVGNLLALRENRLKKLLAYSSVANLGYLLTAFLTGQAWPGREEPALAAQAAWFYLPAYFAALLGALGVISVLANDDHADAADGDADHLSRYRGLFFRRPVLACVLTLMLLSLGGLPLTGGFVGKFLIAWAGLNAGLWTLATLLVLNSAVSLYYYLRIAAALFSRDADVPPASESPSNNIRLTAIVALLGLTLIVLALGLHPGPIIEFIRQTVSFRGD